MYKRQVSDAGAESLGDREDTDSGEAPLVVEDPLFSSTTKGDEAEKTENHEKRGGFAGFLSIKRISVKAKEAGAPQGGKRKTIRTILILAVLLSGVAGFLLFGPDLDLTFNLPSVSEQRLSLIHILQKAPLPVRYSYALHIALPNGHLFFFLHFLHV